MLTEKLGYPFFLSGWNHRDTFLWYKLTKRVSCEDLSASWYERVM